jgi:O-antigen/teichoic acid export membrane protein
MIGVAVQGVATILVLPFVTRLLGPIEYGPVALGLSIIQIGAVLAVAGLPFAITRAYYDPGDGPLRARAMMGLVMSIGLAVMAVALLLLPLIGAVLSLSVAAVGAVSLVVAGQSLLRAQGRPLVFISIALGSTVGAHAVGLGTALLVQRTSSAYLGGYLAGATLAAAAAMLITPPVFPWRVSGAMAEGVRIALPVVPHTAAILVLNNADPLILGQLLGATEAGRYQVAMMLGMAPIAVLSGINNAWMPAVMSASDEERWSFLARTVRPILAVAAVSSLGLALLAPLAVRILAPPSFGHDTLTELAQVVALCVVPQVIYLAAVAVLFNQKRTMPLAISTPVAAAAFVLLATVLVGNLGILGMSLAKLGGFVVLAGVTLVATRRVARVPWQWARWMPIAGVTGLGVLALQFVPATGVAMWLQAGAAAALGVASLGRLVRLLRGGRPQPAPRPG